MSPTALVLPGGMFAEIAHLANVVGVHLCVVIHLLAACGADVILGTGPSNEEMGIAGEK